MKVNHATYIECCVPKKDKQNPKSKNQGMLSLSFSLALMLKYGRLSVDMYNDQNIPPTPDLVKLMAVMHFVDDDELTNHPDYQNDFPAHVAISLQDGTTVEAFRHYHDGDYRTAMSDKSLKSKFYETNQHHYDDITIKKLQKQIDDLQQCENLDQFCQNLNQLLIVS